MTTRPTFGPLAQTREQRVAVLARMKSAVPRLRQNLTPYVQQLHDRYLAGEISWHGVYEALGLAPDG